MKRGHTKSCGKCADRAYNTGLNYLYGSYRRGAIKRGLSFNISKDEFNEIVKKNCVYCGTKPKQIFYKDGMQTPFIYNGIDRVDNNVGYESGNLVPACKFCNLAKGRSTVEEFEEWMNQLVKFKTSQEKIIWRLNKDKVAKDNTDSNTWNEWDTNT